MIRIDHIDVLEIGGRRLVSEIDRMLERQVPDRERFKFCVAGLNAPLMLMIKLRKTGCHFSAARTGSGYDDKLARRFDKFIFAVSLIADNQIHVSGIARDRIVQIGMNAALFQPAAEHVGRLLPAVLRNYDIVYQQPQSPYGIDQA